MLGDSLHRSPTPQVRFPSDFLLNVTLPSVSILDPPQWRRTDLTLLLLIISRFACCSLYLPFLCCTSEEAQVTTLLGRPSLQSPGELVEEIRKTRVDYGL